MNVPNRVARAIREGELVRLDKCEECGVGGRIVGHHDDYRKPLDLRWLCGSCHYRWHREHGAAPGKTEATVIARLPHPLFQQIRDLAKSQKRSVNAQINVLIEEHLKEVA